MHRHSRKTALKILGPFVRDDRQSNFAAHNLLFFKYKITYMRFIAFAEFFQ
jgi:hypothetical protein